LFVLDGTQLYLARYFAAECRLAAAIRARLAEPPMASFEAVVPLFRQLFPHAAQAMDWQALAATAALRSSLTFITGGPGTGKTTVAAKLLALLLQGDATLRIAVAAPTGRAAARLAEAIGAAAAREQLGPVVTQHLPATGSTLHRLLGYQPWADRFTHHAAHPLADDIIVVDEASMVDVLMMDALFAAVKPSARLIVLGDPDQLASVDTGFVLGDIARAARSHGNEGGHSASLAAAYATLSGADPSLLPVSPQATALHDAVIRLRTSYRFGAQPGIGALAVATQAGTAAAAVQVLHDGALSDVAMHAPARSLVELVAGWSMILVATGVFLWWPRKRDAGVVTIKARAGRPLWRDIHAVTGLYAGAVIFFLAATGMPWSAVWGDEVMGAVREAGFGRPAAPAASEWIHAEHGDAPQGAGWTLEHAGMTAAPAPIDLDRILASAEDAAMPRPFLVTLPASPDRAVTVAYQNARSEDARVLYFDRTGDVLRDITAADFGTGARAFEWGIAVHQGTQYGQINRWIMLGACVAVWVLAISALIMWWKRRPKGRLGAPVAPPQPPQLAGFDIPLGIVNPPAPRRDHSDEAIAAPLAFDHATLVDKAVRAMRADIDVLDLPFGCLPDAFTLGELQSFCEHVLGHPLDKSSFRRRLSDRDLLVPVEGEFRVGAFRPAQLFRGPRAGR
jgi:uncharacterized iron-regulated membrane protein